MRNRRTFFLLIVFFTYVTIKAQNLYWTGGDGNYNDPAHWSLTSGGKGGAGIPDALTNVIFDDLSGTGVVNVYLGLANRSREFRVQAGNISVRLRGNAESRLYVSAGLYLSPLTVFESGGKVEFNSGDKSRHLVDFGLNILKTDLYFKSGVYRINALHLSDDHTVFFGKGVYEFQNTSFVAGNMICNEKDAVFKVNSSFFRITGKIFVQPDVQFDAEGMSMNANILSQTDFVMPQNIVNSKKGNHNIVNSCPGIVISTSPSCSGPCTGTLSVFIPGTCTAGPYDILVTNGACSSQAASMSISGLATPTNYIVSNACACPLSNYQVIVFDSIGNVAASQNVNFLANPVTVTGNHTAPTCNTSCDGKITGNIFGSSPFSVTVLPSTVNPSTFTSSLSYTLNNLCQGIYTLNVTDASGCNSIFTRTLSGPSAVAANPVTQSITCNSFSTGAFYISPSGGTPNYTVNFSTGATFAVSPGNTVSVNNLGVGPVSATITDANGCSTIASTNITQPATITIAPSQTNITCGGACTGVASVAVSGGGGTYTYTWSASASTMAFASGLCAGPHTVTIRDNFNCVRTQSFGITQPTSITITPTITHVVCSGSCTGAASVTASGPPPPITFTWMAPPSGNVISNGASVNSRCAGIYTLLASSASDPTCIVSNIINITQPPAITLSPVTQSVNCRGDCTGGATLNVSGGNGSPYTYTWSPAGFTTSSSNVLCAGNHTVTVRDASSCALSGSFTIAEPPAFVFGISTSSVSCNGGCNGVINASPSGGVAPYTYTLASNTATSASGTPIFSGLCAGVYTLLVRDNTSACAQQTVIAITQPNPLAGSVSTGSITCFNLCNGSLAGSASGGRPGYSMSWITPTGTVSGGALTNRCAGNYTFNVTDENGCTAPPVTVALVAPPEMTVAITANNGNCFSSCNGVLSAAVSPAGSYTLSWSNGFTGSPNPGLCAGIYTLTVVNSNGCVKTATAAITTPSVISVTQTVTSTNCAGSCDGSATLTASGGTGSYTFQFNTSPVVTNTTGILGNRCAGNYIATVTDANGCSQNSNFVIPSPPALSAAITGARNSCNSCTGGATVTASNGNPPYVSYAWTNSLNISAGSGSVVSGLCPGNYTVMVTDSRSCTATTSVGISEIVIVTAINGGTGIQCFGACTASAVADVSGGQAPYSYTWSPSNQNTGTALNLCVGIHTVNISDSNNPSCVSTATINVVQPPDLTITTSQTNITCFNTCNGALGANATGGTGIKSYSWSPGGQTTPTISGLCAGTYTLRVTDANGCTKPAQVFTISAPFPAITATMNPVNPTQCSAPNNGSICVNASGGNGTYNYTWSPAVGSNTNCVTGLVAGTYSVIISSAACNATFFTTLTNPAGPVLSALGQQSVSCFGGSNGAATFSATGTGPFTFTWTPSVSFTTTAPTTSASGLSSGTYVIASTDGNQCVSTLTFFVSQPSSVTVNATVNNVACNGGPCNGAVSVSPSGGFGPYTYTWSTGAGASSVTALCAGVYSLVVRDNNLCASTHTFNISVPPALTISAVKSDVKCNAACNGSIVAGAGGGTGAISYTWLPVGAFTGSSTATVLNLCPNVYTVSASDANGCSAGTIITITEPAALTSSLVYLNETCFNSCNGAATLTASGGVPNYSFSWSGHTVTASQITSLCAGNYTGTITDANGCSSAQGFTVTGPPPFTAQLSPTHPKCNAACDGSISTIISGAQGAVSYSWSPMGTGQNPVNLCASNYVLIATDASSCQAQSVITLTNPPLLLANVNYTNPTCNGDCNGLAVSSPSNGTAPYTYSWSSSSVNSPSVSGLCANPYTITVRDINLCEVTQTFVLNEPALLNLNSSVGPATCGSADGSITAVPVGGTPGYTFTWSSPVPPPIATTGSVVTNLSAGIYTVQVRDAGNCTNTVTIPLSNAGGPGAPITSTNVICNGNCTGAASVGLISGSSPPFATPLWIIPTPTVQAYLITGLCAGNYSVELRDSLNCLTYTGTSISEPPPVNIQSSVDLATCFGVCDGSISINTSGGIGPFTYTWTPALPGTTVNTNVCPGTYSLQVGYNNGACVAPVQVFVIPATSSITIAPPSVLPNRCFGDCNASATVNVIPGSGFPSGPVSLNWSNGQSGNSAVNLCNGIYSVTATDVQGCNNTFSVQVVSPQQLSVTPLTTSPECGRCDGSATVTPGGGSGTSYTLNWTNGGSGTTVNNLCAGIYQVMITDSLNCNRTQNIIINNSGGFTGEIINSEDETCPGSCNGAASLTAVGGNAPVSYNWLGSVPANTGTTAAGLCADIYFVQMTDAKGCVRTASIDIEAANNLTVSTFVSPPSCTPGMDGSVTVLVAGGTPPYTYSWSPAAPATSVLANAGAGSYTLIVTDQNGSGCAKPVIVNISNASAPLISALQKNPDCAGACNGSVSVSVNSTFTPAYLWDNGSTSSVLTGLCGGIITLTATTDGCASIRSFTFNESPALQLQTVSHDVTCGGNCDGSISLQPLGGTLPYTFSWSPVTNTTALAQSLCPGGYSVVITDVNGCSLNGTDSILQRPEIQVHIDITDATCSSVPDAAVSVSVTGGTPAFNYSWEGPGGYSSAEQNPINILAGTYSLSVSDSLNCTIDTNVTIGSKIINIASAGEDLDLCPGASAVLSATNSQGAAAYSWFTVPGSSSVSSGQTLLISGAAETQTYMLVTYASNPACSDTDLVVVNVFTEPFIDAGPTFTIPVFSSVTIGGSPTALGIESPTWSPAFALDDPFAYNPVVSGTVDITYTVSISYGNGCLVSDTMRVVIYPEIKLTSGFTPNNDGKNDTWIIDHIEQFPDNTVEIYNRWGERLFYSKGYEVPFDGKYQGGNLPVGTYYYIIHLNHPSYTKPYIGPLTIFR